MRIVKLLVGTGIVAMAFAVAAAAPAYADKEFEIVGPGGVEPCDACLDTGYEGEFTVFDTSDNYVTTCDVQFAIVIDADGSFETANTSIDWCSPYGLAVCDTPWSGQVRVPDTGPVEVDLEMCVQDGFHAEQPFDVTTQTFEPPRRWEQVGEAQSPVFPNPKIVGLHVEDKEESDNVGVHLLP